MSQFWVGGTGGGGGGSVLTITGNSGGAVSPDGTGNLDLVGAGGITVTGSPGSHTLTITGSSSSISWTDESSSFTATAGNGYFASAALTMTLPASPTQGNVIYIIVDTVGTVVVQAAAGQEIVIGNTASSIAGTATSTADGCALALVYRAADQFWIVNSSVGSWILA